MKLLPIPAFSDNYIWLLHDGADAVVVDPGDAAPVLQTLDALRLRLSAIVLTHHHRDHSAGVAALHAHTAVPIWEPAAELARLPELAALGAQAASAASGDVRLLGLSWRVLDVPGHTAGHIAWFCEHAPDIGPLLFCGDVLFDGGCGRVFEGTHAQMHASLQMIAALSANTIVCPAHEYTLSNLDFAQRVEPANAALAAHRQRAAALRAQGLPTLPTTLAVQRAINPFLRTHEDAVVQAARRFNPALDVDNPAAIFAALREWKNQS